jgi:hypothetical protein
MLTHVCFLLRFQHQYVNEKRQEWEAGLIFRWLLANEQTTIHHSADCPLENSLKKGM